MQQFSVMMIDDEEWIVKGLSTIIDWRQEGFEIAGKFTDPMKALAAIRENEPDLLLLDIRMPKISGDVFMEIIREEGIACSFIILSGYEDFSVAQKAIQHDAIDYLLKPFEKAGMLKAVRKAHKVLSTQQKKSEDMPIDPTNEKAFFSRAFSTSEWERLPSFPLYQLMQTSTAQILTLPKIAGALVSKPVPLYGGHALWLIATTGDDALASGAALRPWARENELVAGLSKTAKSLQAYHNLYRQTNCALCNRVLGMREDCYSYQPPNVDDVAQWEGRLEKVCQSKDAHSINLAIGDLVDQWKLDKNPASISLFFFQLMHRLIRDSGGALKESSLEKFLFDDITSQFASMEKMVEFLQMLLVPSAEKLPQDPSLSPQIVVDIKACLQEEYHMDINLNQLAGRFFLSPSYMSSLFKQFTGYTLTSFLLRIRMERASDLLLKGGVPLIDISEAIGYNDYNYFCRLFKRYYGVSPTTYQKRNSARSDI